MIEIPESNTLTKQLNETIIGKKIKCVIANYSAHKFAWFYKDPKDYPLYLNGKTIQGAKALGGHVEISVEDGKILISDGINLRYYLSKNLVPTKHQLLIEFNDESTLVGSVQMYGGLWVFPNDEFKYHYYQVSKEKPSPLSDQFTKDYFINIFNNELDKKLSAKAFLATEQRIPGLGNGVLQDILFNAKISPKRKINTLSEEEVSNLFLSIKTTLKEMTLLGGRDTEKDLFGLSGGYKTLLSSKTNGTPCQVCQTIIKKEAYLGGSIYYCEKCQK